MSSLSVLERQAILANLVSKMGEVGSWAGETHIQKCVFFFQEMLVAPSLYEYVLYKHGPYSFDLHDELTAMKANFILEIEPRLPYGPSYRLGELAQRVMARSHESNEEYDRELDFIAKTLSNQGVSNLERLATALYVSNENPGTSESEQAKLITILKPHISLESAMQALAGVESIKQCAKAEDLKIRP